MSILYIDYKFSDNGNSLQRQIDVIQNQLRVLVTQKGTGVIQFLVDYLFFSEYANF